MTLELDPILTGGVVAGQIPASTSSAEAQVAAASAWGLSGRATLLLANLLATPFTIRLLGPARYGLWTLLLLTMSWAQTSDLGMALASIKFGSDRHALGDDRGESSVVWDALGIVGVTSVAVAIGVAIGARDILAHLLHVRGDLLGSGTLALRIGCAVFVLQSAAQIVIAPQVVRLRWRANTLVNVSAALVGSVGTPLVLFVLGGGVVTAELVALASALGAVVGGMLVSLRLLPMLRFPRFDRAATRQLVKYGGALLVTGVVGIPLSTAERFFLGHNHSTTVVAYYAVAATLATTLQVLPEQIGGPLLPGLTRLEAEGRVDEHRSLYRKALAGMFLVLTPCAILLAFVAHPFLSLWAGPQYGIHSTGPLLVVIGGVWFNCLAWIPLSYMLSSGRTKRIAAIQVSELVPYLVAAWFLTEKFGAMGAAIAWGARLAVDAVICFLAVRLVNPLPILPLSERRALSVAAPLGLGICAWLFASFSEDLLVRGALAAVLGLAYAAVVWWVVLSERERTALSSLVGEVFRRGPPPRHGRPAVESR